MVHLLLLVSLVAAVSAFSVSNRTACFKYIDCLESAQSTFKFCSKGTGVALGLETKNMIFLDTVQSNFGIVKLCQDKVEFDTMDFDSMQVLVNEESRDCFRKMHKRRRGRQTKWPECEVQHASLRPQPRSPYQCLQDFKVDRKRCEQLLNCCPEHVRCAQQLNEHSIPYAEAKKKASDVSVKMLNCVHEKLGRELPFPLDNKKEENENSQSFKRHIPNVEQKKKNLRKHTLQAVPAQGGDREYAKIHKNSKVTMDEKQVPNGQYSFGPKKTERVTETQTNRDKQVLQPAAGSYSFGPKGDASTLEETKQIAPSSDINGRESASEVAELTQSSSPVLTTTQKEPISTALGSSEVELIRKLEVEPAETIIENSFEVHSTPKTDEVVTTEVSPAVKEDSGETLAPSVDDLSKAMSVEDSTTVVEDITSKQEEKKSEETPETSTNDEKPDQPEESTEKREKTSSEAKMISSPEVTVEEASDGEKVPAVEESEASNEKLAKMTASEGAADVVEDLDGEEEPAEPDTPEWKAQLVKFLLESADPAESTLYLQLVSENNYTELERIAVEKQEHMEQEGLDELNFRARRQRGVQVESV